MSINLGGINISRLVEMEGPLGCRISHSHWNPQKDLNIPTQRRPICVHGK